MMDTDTRTVFQQVSEAVSPVYLVGGSVRDILLGNEPHDYDFATPLSPEEVEEAVRRAGKRPYTSGKRFGTVGFRIGSRVVEITAFRLETYTPGSRKPQVEFVGDITHDLSRRDFTINAMAMRPGGSLIDPFGGKRDLKKRLIRTVNKPFERYDEDPLRMLRAARFAAQLGFDVEKDTEHQAVKKAYKILEVSKERWTQELDKLLMSDRPERGLDFLARTRLLNFMIPELAIQIGYDQDSPYHQLELWDHSVKTVSLAPKELAIRWAALLHDVGKPYVRARNKRGYSNYVHHDTVGAELADKIGRHLRWPSERTRTVSLLVRNHLEPGSPLLDADTAATKTLPPHEGY